MGVGTAVEGWNRIEEYHRQVNDADIAISIHAYNGTASRTSDEQALVEAVLDSVNNGDSVQETVNMIAGLRGKEGLLTQNNLENNKLDIDKLLDQANITNAVQGGEACEAMSSAVPCSGHAATKSIGGRQ